MRGVHFISKLLDEAGVRWITLESCATLERGRRVTKSELSPEKKYPVYSGGVTPMGFYDNFNQTKNTVTVVKYGTAGFVNYIETDFWANDVCYCIKPSETLNSKYLFYYLKNQQKEIQSLATDAIPAHLPTEEIASYPIPIPCPDNPQKSLKIQAEIVRMLDSFTELTNLLNGELTAELTARKKQYSYYRDKLFYFEDGEVEWKSLGSIATYSKNRISSARVDSMNYVGVDNILPNRAGKTESNYVQTEGNLTAYQDGDVLIGNIRPYLKKIWYADRVGGTNGDVLVIHLTDQNVLARYLYQVLADDKFFEYNMQHAKGAKMPRGNKEKIMEFLIPIPYAEEPEKSLAEQARIVAILDKFDSLNSAITEALPREVELRQKQYEHYRGLLLSFPKPESASV